jgi:predicted nucleotidyltransferase
MRRFAGEVASLLGGRLVGIYLEGSFAWGAELPTSDVDLRVVVDGSLEVEAEERLRAITRRATSDVGHPIDVQTESLEDLVRTGAVRFQHAILIAGRDVRLLVPLKPMEAFTAMR